MAWIRRVIGLVLATLATVFGHAIWRLGEAATTEWVNHQIAEKYGIVSPSQQQVIDFAVSWALPAALAVLLVYAVFRAGAWWERRRVAMPAVATVSAPAPTTQIASRPPTSRAKIIFGTGHPFETVAQSGINRSRTVRAKIINETDAEISNGMLQLLGLVAGIFLLILPPTMKVHHKSNPALGYGCLYRYLPVIYLVVCQATYRLRHTPFI
jgi:hypothetical protein